MVDIWKKFFDLSKTLYTSIFEVVKYEFEIEILKFIMADLTWPTTSAIYNDIK